MSELPTSTCWNKEGHCLHWLQIQQDKPGVLAWGSEIPTNERHRLGLLEHLATTPGSVSDGSTKGCGNPWNVLSQEYAQEIRRSRPEAQLPPTPGSRPVTDIVTLTQAQLEKHLKDTIAADTWVVYSRWPITHEIHNVFFDLRDDRTRAQDNDRTRVQDIDRTRAQDIDRTRAQDIARKTELSENVSALMGGDLAYGKELCLSLGGEPFCDYYISRVRGQELFVVVRVDCVDRN